MWRHAAPVPLCLSLAVWVESLRWSLLWYDAVMNICLYPRLPRRWTGTIFACSLLLWVLRSQEPGPMDLSPPWVVSRPHWKASVLSPGDGLHKVVGDLPLVLKQVFNLRTVCITCEGTSRERVIKEMATTVCRFRKLLRNLQQDSIMWHRCNDVYIMWLGQNLPHVLSLSFLSSPAWHPYM